MIITALIMGGLVAITAIVAYALYLDSQRHRQHQLAMKKIEIEAEQIERLDSIEARKEADHD